MVRQFSNTAVEAELTSSAADVDVTIDVDSTSGFPVTFPYTLSIDAETASKELVEVTAAAGTTLTVTRGIDGTSAQAHSLGAAVRHDHSARDFREAQEHIAAEGDVHGVTGDLVGTTMVQTVTNKDFSDPSNTFPASLTTDAELTAAIDAEEAIRAAADTTNANAIADHIADATDAHDASAVSFSPTGTIAATDVQAAVAEAASEAVQKALADAKGDLFVATAADTIARKAVGANGAILVADSAQSDGLRYTTALRFEGEDSPEGVVTAPVGSSYSDTTNGVWYVKAAGAGNTGWAALTTGNIVGANRVFASDATFTNPTTNTVLSAGADKTALTKTLVKASADSLLEVHFHAQLNATVAASTKRVVMGLRIDGTDYDIATTYVIASTVFKADLDGHLLVSGVGDGSNVIEPFVRTDASTTVVAFGTLDRWSYTVREV